MIMEETYVKKVTEQYLVDLHGGNELWEIQGIYGFEFTLFLLFQKVIIIMASVEEKSMLSFPIKQFEWMKWVGHMPGWTEFLDEKSWFSGWAPVKWLSTFFTALGVIVFATNPVTGFFIFIGLLIGNFSIATASVLAGLASVICNAVMRTPEKRISNGVLVFNCILFACVTTGTIPPSLDIALTISFWIYLLVSIVCTNFLDIGLNTFLSQFDLPGLSLPFNLVAAVFFLVLRNCVELGTGFIAIDQTTGPQITIDFSDAIHWTKVGEGVLLAYSQVFGINYMPSTLIMWFGTLFCSPLLTLLLFFGSLTGTLIGLLFDAAPYTNAYVGLWGYNGLLTAGGISFFTVQNPVGIFASIFGAVLATVIQVAIQPIFSEVSMPVWSYPFNLTVLLILSTALREESPIVMVHDRTFPELHLHKHNMDYKKPTENRTDCPITDIPTIVVSENENHRNSYIDHGLGSSLGSIPEDEISTEPTQPRKGSDDDSINLDDIVFSSKLSRTRNSKVFLSPNAFGNVRKIHSQITN